MIVDQSTILVVDDELFFRKLYRDLLSAEGYLVEVCENGEEAIARMQHLQIDLVLSDMVMPGKCGLEVLRAAQALPNPPEVILVTGYASLESAIHALKNGARDYLVKPFNPDELKHLVKTCLDQRRLLGENDHLKKQIRLFQSAQSLSSLIDLERLLPQALSALLREVGATTGCSFKCRDGETAVLSSIKGFVDRLLGQRLADALLPGMEVSSGFVQPDAVCRRQLHRLGLKPEQVWMLPLGDSEGLKGGLVACDAPVGLSDKVAMADLRYLCDQIGLGFENASRYQDAQELMYTDDLTGLYNNRYMQVIMAQEIRRSQRYGLEFSLIFLDLDHFKLINDTHGHLAGSAALQEVGQLLQQCVRDVDTLFRFGGDEFGALLVETDSRTARIVAERIRRTIDGNVFLQERGTPCRLTATAGFATFPTDAVDREKLLDLADRAMYVGKVERNAIRGVEEIPEE
jgi:diguanylate cyclase (GGDEF)-like protein